jgi:structural maintenance of chromosome 2
VDAMADETEKAFQSLIARREIVVKDKQKLLSVIQQLDHKKKEAIQDVFTHVNKQFASVFTSLLPTAQCKLHALDGKALEEGIEFKVAFGSVWKLSLSELSGGQRSLLSLSFVLALLLYRPAPMYILDEIDAALDLSHTQNIGDMIRKHFPQSQFIIVSLKEGMFNNANVVYRVSFADGVSKVDRLLLRSSTAQQDNLKKKKKKQNNLSFTEQ